MTTTAVSTPSLRFRYNPAFLPEYASTVLISIAWSAVFLVNPMPGVPPLAQNPHATLALVLYGLAAVWLVHATLDHRSRFAPLRLTLHPGQKTCVSLATRSKEVRAPSGAVERLGRFFGRRARTMRIWDDRGNEITIVESLMGYDALRRAVEQLVPGGVGRADTLDDDLARRVQFGWAVRHELWPNTLLARVRRSAFRCLALLPVVFFDLAANLMLTGWLLSLGCALATVYVPFLGLVGSALVARCLYYYVFTSRRMNTSPGRGLPIAPPSPPPANAHFARPVHRAS